MDDQDRLAAIKTALDTTPFDLPDLGDPDHWDQKTLALRLDDPRSPAQQAGQLIAAAVSPEARKASLGMAEHLRRIDAMRIAGTALQTEHEQAVEKALQRMRANAEATRLFRVERLGTGAGAAFIDEAELMSWEAPQWLVEGLVPEGALAFMAGPSGVGKSFLALDMALSVAYGQDFLDLPTIQGPTLYVAGEGARGLRSRVAAWHEHHGVPQEPGRFSVMSTGAVLSDDELMDEMVRGVAERGIRFVILDTWSQLAGVENENDAAQAAMALRSAARLRDAVPGASVLIVHHLNGEKTKLRGSTALYANADTVVSVSSEGDIGDGAAFSLTTKADAGGKQKDGAALSIEGLCLVDAGPGKAVGRGTHALLDGSPGGSRTSAFLSMALTDGRDYTTAELIDLLTSRQYISDRSAERAIVQAVQDGTLEKVGRGTYRCTHTLLDELGIG